MGDEVCQKCEINAKNGWDAAIALVMSVIDQCNENSPLCLIKELIEDEIEAYLNDR